MSFDLYFAGGSANDIVTSVFDKNSSSRLFSNLNDRKIILSTNKTGKIFVDSGAYSAYTKNKIVNVDDYINFLNTNTHKFDLFAQVDKIPGEYGKKKTMQQIQDAPKQSWENYLYMRNRVVEKDKLLPVFHRREDFKYLENMLLWKDENNRHIPYIALAPTTDSSTKEKDIFLSECFDLISRLKRDDVKTHLFGVTSLELIKKYPANSCDSTMWIKAAIFGEIVIILKNRAIRVIISDKRIKLKKDIEIVIDNYCNVLGYNIEDLKDNPISRQCFNIDVLQSWANNHNPNEIKRKQYVRRLF